MLGILKDSKEYLRLSNERQAVGMKLCEASTELQAIGLPKNFVKLQPEKAIEIYGKEKVEQREYWSNLILTYQGQMKRINEQLKPFNESEHQIKSQILLEIFTKEQISAINVETKRRLSGEQSIRLDFGVHRIKKEADAGNKHKKLATDLVKTLINAREKLNDVIREGCSKYGNADFLKIVSPINQSIQPISELQKLRRIENI